MSPALAALLSAAEMDPQNVHQSPPSSPPSPDPAGVCVCGGGVAPLGQAAEG